MRLAINLRWLNAKARGRLENEVRRGESLSFRIGRLKRKLRMDAKEPRIITFGCRLNLYESEVIRAHLLAVQMTNAVVVNSCAVTGEAERQVRQTIRKLRRENPDACLIVTGCAAQLAPEKYTAMPEVDFVIDNNGKLDEARWRRVAGQDDVAPVQDRVVTSFSGGLTRGFVPVQYGCDHDCTFCIVPRTRGTARSLPLETIVRQVRALVVEAGYPEIALTGVDIASYDGQGMRLGGLVRALLREVPELKRLRLSSLDPAALDDELWRLIADEPRLMPHMHLSLQAGDDMVLKRMKRRHSRAQVQDIVARARGLRPDMAFGADIIAGFPTETDEMFENTCALVRDTGLSTLHVFPFSARAGTPAARMPQVPMEIRRARAARLRELGEAALAMHIDGLRGRRLQIHIEQPRLGRTPCFTEVVLDADEPVGAVVEVTIMGRQGLQASAHKDRIQEE